MKLITWNVNGIRAVHNKDAFSAVFGDSPDVICLQETKAQKEQLPDELIDIDGYKSYFHSAEKKGYSGLASYTSKEPLSVKDGVGDPLYDCEGRVMTLEFDDFYLINSYVPNAQHKLARLDYRMDFNDKLKDYMVELNKKKGVILCGDLNVAHKPIDLKNPESNQKNPGYSIEERDKFTELLNAGFVDIYRKMYPEKVEYTWWSYRFNARSKGIGWRIDYFVVSEDMAGRVEDVKILGDVMGSDHCPVMLDLK